MLPSTHRFRPLFRPGIVLVAAWAAVVPMLAGAEVRSSSAQSTGGLEWMFFPPAPPALGAEVSVAAASRRSSTPEVLRAFVTEPFYAQLAARVVHVSGEPDRKELLETEEFVRLDFFLGLRSALIGEIYERFDPILKLAPKVRPEAFASVAQAQQARFEEMEQTAEWLRKHLARTDSWDEHRRWRLNRGELQLPREKTFVLEYEVVRAAAYYQEGFSPEQRWLIRELAIEMNEAIATEGRLVESELVFFFSPDTARILRPRDAPVELEALIASYIAQKRRLKDELREIIYRSDAQLVPQLRAETVRELSGAQVGAIAGLEAVAEEIRTGIARLPDYRRFVGGVRLSAALEERLVAFSASAKQIEKDRNTYIVQRLREERAGKTGGIDREALNATVVRARAAFELEQSDRLMAHERMVDALFADLAAALPPEERVRLNGSPEVAVRDFLERRNEQDGYADYDLAVLEPGLSAPQRRLLLGAALSRLRQFTPPPVLQPTDPPGTLIGPGEKLPRGSRPTASR